MDTIVDSSRTGTGRASTVRTCVGVASLLAFGTIAWQHLVYSLGAGPRAPLGSHLTHALRDGALAWPLAALAVVAGLWIARRLRLADHGSLGLLGRSAVIATGFAALLVPGVAAHALVDAGLGGGSAALLSMAQSIGSNLGRFFAYGAQQALVALVAAWPLALLGLTTSSCACVVTRSSPLQSAPGAGGGRGDAPGRRPNRRRRSGRRRVRGHRRRRALVQVRGRHRLCPGRHRVAGGRQARRHRADHGRGRHRHQSTPSRACCIRRAPRTCPSISRWRSRRARVTRSPSTSPGLYVFVCKLHPFMLAAAIVDDPATDRARPRREPLARERAHLPQQQ